jgi:hypothetical protein
MESHYQASIAQDDKQEQVSKDYLLGMMCAIAAINGNSSLDFLIRKVTHIRREVTKEDVEYIREELGLPSTHTRGNSSNNRPEFLNNRGYHFFRPVTKTHLMKNVLPFRAYSSGKHRMNISFLSDMGIDINNFQRYVVRVQISGEDYYDGTPLKLDTLITYNTPDFRKGMSEIFENSDLYTSYDIITDFKLSNTVET